MMDYQALLTQARATNAERDAVDRSFGHKTPLDAGTTEVVATATSPASRHRDG